MDKEKYLKDFSECPYCGSGELDHGDFDAHGRFISQRVTCLDCDKVWNDIYKLTDVSECLSK